MYIYIKELIGLKGLMSLDTQFIQKRNVSLIRLRKIFKSIEILHGNRGEHAHCKKNCEDKSSGIDRV